MQAVAHSPAFAKKAGVPQSVGRDFTAADKGRKFSKGGDTMATKMNPGFMAMMSKKKDGGKGGMPAALAKHAGKPASKAHKGLKSGGAVDGIAQRGKTMANMKRGGMAC
jgi:hypothetical protein